MRNSTLPLGEKLGYAVGDAGFNFYWIIIGSYLAYFYTDVFGLPAAAAGTLFLITKIIDAFSDPLMGAIADRTSTRWGKYRPYLLFGALPMSGAAVLTMSTPSLGDTGKLIWAYGTYSVMMLCYTILSTPYSSLAGVVTANADERNSLFGLRFFFAYSTGIIVGAFTPGLADYFGNGNAAHGWQMTMLLYSSIATVCFITVFFTTRERIQPAEKPGSPLLDLKDLTQNKPWLILFALAMIIMITITLRGSSATYYFKYFVERPDLMGAFIGTQMAAYAIGCLCTPMLTRRFDKPTLLISLMAVVALFSSAMLFIPKPASTGVVTVDTQSPATLKAVDLLGKDLPTTQRFLWTINDTGVFWFIKKQTALPNTLAELNIPTDLVTAFENNQEKIPESMTVSVKAISETGSVLADSSFLPKEIMWMFIFNIVISLALGPKSPLTWSMYADAADYNEWKTGRRATAMTFAAATFSQKLGGALGSAGVLWLLASVGYVANQMQDGASVNSIVWLQTIVPGVFALLSIVILIFYSLDKKLLITIQQDLEQRDSLSKNSK